MDKYFRVNVLNQTIHPQMVIYAALHQDYSEQYVFEEQQWVSDYSTASYYNNVGVTEKQAGEIAVKRLLAGNRGHFGCIEHPQIVFSVGYFPHSTMQQIRTHRIGCSFDVQSFRYTGKRLYDVGLHLAQFDEGYTPGRWNYSDTCREAIEEIVYLRPEGEYTDRQGTKYTYTNQARLNDLAFAAHAIIHYAYNIDRGHSEEHARGLIPFDVRQHWVMSFNLRSLMHLLDLRYKQDAQLECQQLCELIYPHFESWVPEIAEWYGKNRLHKARLAP